jgi:hypothetical protein
MKTEMPSVALVAVEDSALEIVAGGSDHFPSLLSFDLDFDLDIQTITNVQVAVGDYNNQTIVNQAQNG